MITLLLALQFVIPSHTGPVTDIAHALSAPMSSALERQLNDYQRRTSNALVILVVPTLNGVSIEEAATSVFHTWGIGDKVMDNGVLFMWSVGDRKVRIEVGYGLEALLPDGRAGQIIREDIGPSFRTNNWDAGAQAGVNAIIEQLDRVAAPLPIPAPNNHLGVLVIVSLLILLVVVLIWWATRREKDEDEPERRPDRPYVPIPEHFHRDPPYVPVPIVIGVTAPDEEPARSSRRDDDERPSSRPSYESSSSDDGGSFGGFGGGDSGGGGASGSF